MAIFPTVLQDAIVNVPYSNAFKQFEGRGSIYDVINAFRDNTERLVPKAELEAAKKSSGHVAKIPVLNKVSPTGLIRDTRSCTPEGLEITSTFVQPTYSTYSFSFDMVPHDNNVNYISYQEDFAWKLMQSLQAFGETLDLDLIAYLEANKSAINTSALFGGIVGAEVTVAGDSKEDFYKSIPSIMYRNDLSGNRVIDIANPESQIMYDSIARQGAGNAVNTAYQISNFAPYRSNRVPLASGMSETHFLVPEGHLGILDWIPFEYSQGLKISDGDLWGSLVDPLFGFTWGLRYVAQCTDRSAVVGGTADHTTAYVEKFEFSIDLAPLSSYSSDTSSAIYKYQIAEPVVEA